MSIRLIITCDICNYEVDKDLKTIKDFNEYIKSEKWKTKKDSSYDEIIDVCSYCQNKKISEVE